MLKLFVVPPPGCDPGIVHIRRLWLFYSLVRLISFNTLSASDFLVNIFGKRVSPTWITQAPKKGFKIAFITRICLIGFDLLPGFEPG